MTIDFKAIVFKKLQKNEVKTLVQWAKREGWNPGNDDYKAFWNADPDGFYGFFLAEKLIAAGTIISYNGAFGFMGLFIVLPEYRGHGLGKKLWYLRRDLLLDRLKSNATIGMDGVVAMQPFYEKGGFKIAFKDERYGCLGQKLSISNLISKIENADFDQIAHYDRQCFGFDRKDFLKSWINLPNSYAYKYTKNKKLLGFTVLRKVDSGYKIGPLFADDGEVAEELYKACLNSVLGEYVYLDIPVVNNGAVALVNKYKAEYVFECARMYYQNIPELPVNKIFGITTFELG